MRNPLHPVLLAYVDDSCHCHVDNSMLSFNPAVSARMECRCHNPFHWQYFDYRCPKQWSKPTVPVWQYCFRYVCCWVDFFNEYLCQILRIRRIRNRYHYQITSSSRQYVPKSRFFHPVNVFACWKGPWKSQATCLNPDTVVGIATWRPGGTVEQCLAHWHSSHSLTNSLTSRAWCSQNHPFSPTNVSHVPTCTFSRCTYSIIVQVKSFPNQQNYVMARPLSPFLIECCFYVTVLFFLLILNTEIHCSKKNVPSTHG